MRLVKDDAENSWAGSWSPDGNWFVYPSLKSGSDSLNKVKTTGQAQPEVLNGKIIREPDWLPAWSPAGDRILYSDNGTKRPPPTAKPFAIWD